MKALFLIVALLAAACAFSQPCTHCEQPTIEVTSLCFEEARVICPLADSSGIGLFDVRGCNPCPNGEEPSCRLYYIVFGVEGSDTTILGFQRAAIRSQRMSETCFNDYSYLIIETANYRVPSPDEGLDTLYFAMQRVEPEFWDDPLEALEHPRDGYQVLHSFTWGFSDTCTYVSLQPNQIAFDFDTVGVGGTSDTVVLTLKNTGTQVTEYGFAWFNSNLYLGFRTDHPMDAYTDLGPGDSVQVRFWMAPLFEFDFVDTLQVRIESGALREDGDGPCYIRTAYYPLHGVGVIPTSADEEKPIAPMELGLGKPYPNPFNAVTTIPFEISKGGDVTFEVFDLLGRSITRWSLAARSGKQEIAFDAGKLPSGVYFVQLHSTEGVWMQKILLMK